MRVVEALISALLVAGLYATMSYGLALIYGVMKIINLANAGVMMLAAFATFFLWQTFGLDPLVSVFLVAPLFFLVGALLYIGRRRVPMTWPLFAAAMLGLLVALVIGLEPPVIALLSYGVIFLSTRRGGTGWRRITRLGDPSYGIYIYAYPIQQLLVHLRVAPNWWILFLEASVASVVVGYLSWHLVEHRALVFARRTLRRPAAETVARPDLSTAA